MTLTSVLGRIILRLLIFLPSAIQFSYLPKQKTEKSSYDEQMEIKSIIKGTQIPYHVLIVYNNLYCSGALTSSKIVVTAASCIHINNNDKIYVKVGSDSITGDGQIIPVVEIKIHEYFKHRSRYDNDIAMIILQNHASLGDNVMKVVLVEPDVALRDNTMLKVSGWGSTDLGAKYVNRLVQTDMYVMAKEECETYYSVILTSSMYCAKYLPEHHLSDNGGPAVFEDFLVGIVSVGANNKNPPYVAVLTNISYFHRWLALNTDRFLKKYCTIIDTDDSSDDNYDTYHN